MVDLVSTGVSGLAAYQRALAVTGNNIANLQTEGYVRQRAILEPNAQDATSRNSLGTGVNFAGIQRLYDKFLEDNVRDARSDLAAQDSLLTQLSRLQDSIGDSETGLHGALQKFFDAARGVEASPADVGARATFLATADSLASRFRSLGSATADLEQASREELDYALSKANAIVSQLATVNRELIKRRSERDQPMQLLDQRDALLKELSAIIGNTVEEADSGAVTVFPGDTAAGIPLLEQASSRELSAVYSRLDPARVDLVLNAKTNPVVIGKIASGTVGGIVTFRSQALSIVTDQLDRLALAFTEAVNEVHQAGLDATGAQGKPLFFSGPQFIAEGDANRGNARLVVSVQDATQFLVDSHEARFDAESSRWSVRNLRTGESSSGDSAISLNGLQFVFSGTAADNDSFRIEATQRPAQTMRLLVEQTDEVAAAGRLGTTPFGNNPSRVKASVDLLEEERLPARVALVDHVLPNAGLPTTFKTLSAGSAPLFAIPAGTKNLQLQIDGPFGGIAVFTRDGRQIYGDRLSPSQQLSLVNGENGFREQASYSDEYLGKFGTDSYLDHQFTYGLTSKAGEQVDSFGNVVRTPATLQSSEIDTGGLTGVIDGAVRINGVALPALEAVPGMTLSAKDIANWINHSNIAGVSSSATTTIRLTEDDVVGQTQLSMTINGISVNTGSLSGRSPADSLQSLAAAINAQTAATRVVATLDADGLLLTNSPASAGESIDIRSAAFLQIDRNRTYAGSITLLAEAELRLETDPAVDAVAGMAGGAASTLNILGFRSSFAMREPLAEDLLVFGLGTPEIAIAASYAQGQPPASLRTDDREYLVSFSAGGNYTVIDTDTSTIVANGTYQAGQLLTYGRWQLTFDGDPQNGDRYKVAPTSDPLGDNRNAARLSLVQNRTGLLGGEQTLQQEYTALVNRLGAQNVQAEVARNAGQVVLDNASEKRDAVAGVNLDEELANLLRFQQAYQANAQVIQTASRIFDSLLQRL